MNIKIIDKNGVTLKTKGKYCKEDISVSVDESLMGVTPSGTYQVTDNGEYDITEYAKVNVNVAGGGGGATGYVDGTITEYNGGQETKVRQYAFYYCEQLESINIPNAESVGTYAFYYCKKLKSANLPNVITVEQNAFYYCEQLESINIPKVTSILESAFRSNNSLKAIILGNEIVCTIPNVKVFQYCNHLQGIQNDKYNPTSAKDGYIYVLDSLVNDYKQATNWATFADQIKPLSELPQEYKDLYNIA